MGVPARHHLEDLEFFFFSAVEEGFSPFLP
jgi:hypothetical protein